MRVSHEDWISLKGEGHSRCQYLLQQGTFVAQALCYYGDHVPNFARLKEDDPAKVLPGYDCDVTNEEILLQLKVVDGEILIYTASHRGRKPLLAGSGRCR